MSCSHLEVVVDRAEDTRVCTVCGLVLEQGAVSLHEAGGAQAVGAPMSAGSRKWLERASTHYALDRGSLVRASYDVAALRLTARHPENIVAAALLRSGKNVGSLLKLAPPRGVHPRLLRRAITRVQQKLLSRR